MENEEQSAICSVWTYKQQNVFDVWKKCANLYTNHLENMWTVKSFYLEEVWEFLWPI